MESHLTEEALWANGVAARLRLIQANFADDEASLRQNYLSEELERSLKAVAPSRRDGHLRALGDFFPAWGGGSAPRAAVVAEPGAPAPPETPEEILNRLIDSAALLTEEEKAALARRLQQAGLAPKESAGASAEATPEFWKFFGLATPKPVSADRAHKMLVALSGVFLALDQLAWTLWRQFNAKSIYRKEAEFGKLAGPYLANDPEVSTEQIRQPLERTRRLIAALLGALGRGSANFSRRQSTNLSPESIENAARIEKKAWESLEATSWRKYKELYREYSTEQMIESQVQTEFVKAAEELLKGIGR
ncbi:MAG: hypothetical protein HZA90_24250 [Verrucomicrobia bacterium]|nr:hypothetical protein [Verrucomicrobiota bacterium]